MTYHKINFSLNTKQQPDSLNLDHFQDKAKKAQQQVQELINTKHSLIHIKEHLFRLIDAMTKNLSLFSYAALEWSKIPLWQKVVTGIVLTVPFFLIGVAAHLAILVTFALVASVVYTASSYLLDNHQDQATQNTEQLKQGVASIASLLDTIICSLELLRAQLAAEIESFHKENGQLKSSIEQFKGKIEVLNTEIKELTVTKNELRVIEEDLKKTIKSLDGTINEQSKLLKTTQNQLAQTIKKYRANEKKLAARINELTEMNKKIELELSQVRQISHTLKETVSTLLLEVVKTEEQRAEFLTRLDDFLNNEKASFDRIIERFGTAEKQLIIVTRELAEANQRHHALLDLYEEQLIQLEQMREFSTPNIPLIQEEQSINAHRFYAQKPDTSPSPAPISYLPMACVH